MAFWLEQVLNGLQLGAMLFLMASGLTLVLGIMNLVNLAHGSLYMAGAFFAATLIVWSGGSFAVAVIGAVIGTALLGLFLDTTILRFFYQRDHLQQVLCTFGIILVANELVRAVWGPVPLAMPVPRALAGSIDLLGLRYSTYRLLIIAVGIAVGGALYLLLSRTRAGMLVRAGASDRMMVQLLGVNIGRLNHIIFAVGAALAGLAGAMAGPLLAVQSGMGEPILIMTLVVIVIGGIGSVKGAFTAAIIVGLLDTFGRILLPAALSSILIYMLMAFVLFFRPSGLFPVPGSGAAHHGGLASKHDYAAPKLSAQTLRAPIVLLTLAFFAAVPWIADYFGEPFYIRFFTRTMLFAIAAISLALVMNYGGMVSFGHAAFVGVGSYVVAILSFHASNSSAVLGLLPGTDNALIAWPIALACSASAGLLIGAVSVRTSGLYFIMITLAFAQMLFYFFIALPTYGGESGLQMSGRSVLWPIDLESRFQFYYLVFVVMAGCLALTLRLIRSPFGLALNGGRQNPQRVRALGLPLYRQRLVAFTVSGAMAGLAGILLANFQAFATPTEMAWSRSGEFLIMVILGGVTPAGPILGALAFQVVELLLQSWTQHWEMFFGLLLIAYVAYPPSRILRSISGAAP